MNNKDTGKLWSAIMFIVLGLIFLMEEFFPHIDFEDFWPVLLIITGMIMIYDGISSEELTHHNKKLKP